MAWLALLPMASACLFMLRRLGTRHQPAPVAVPPNVPAGVTITEEVIVNRTADGSVRAFAARCTHLGCRLDRVVDGVIVCACHGSRFHSDGRVAAGPAARPLTELRVTRATDTGGWTVHVT